MEKAERYWCEDASVEFKRERPKDAGKYLKTVVAFANGRGGELIFGIDPRAEGVVGIPEEALDAELTALANVISDQCCPPLYPLLEVVREADKFLIRVLVEEGRQKPYYLRSAGLEAGCFVRVGSSTRPVDNIKLKELILEGENRSMDSLLSDRPELSSEEVEAFCAEITVWAKAVAEKREAAAAPMPLTVAQLVSWGVIVEREGKYLATLAYDLLSGRARGAARVGIQCGCFPDEERSFFIDQATCEGPLSTQLEEAQRFIWRNLRHPARVFNLLRQESLELPPEALREALINALCHRSYLDGRDTQVAVYPDRLEITSPGSLYRITPEELQKGISRPRNQALARVFFYVGLVERWGNGIRKIERDCRAFGLEQPALENLREDFRVTFYRASEAGGGYGPGSQKALPLFFRDESAAYEVKPIRQLSEYGYTWSSKRAAKPEPAPWVPESENREKLLHYIAARPYVRTPEIAALLGVTERRARKLLGEYVEAGVLKKEGAARSTRYSLI